MSCSSHRSVFGRFPLLLGGLLLATAACSNPGQGTPAREAAPPPPPRTFTLAAGTVLSVRTNYTLSTDKQSAGDKFEASLAEPIVDGDWVVAREGAAVEGLVVASSKGAAIGAAIGGAGGTAVVLGTRGEAAEIPAGSRLHFRVKEPVEISKEK
jgi:hypothetical protein